MKTVNIYFMVLKVPCFHLNARVISSIANATWEITYFQILFINPQKQLALRNSNAKRCILPINEILAYEYTIIWYIQNTSSVEYTPFKINVNTFTCYPIIKYFCIFKILVRTLKLYWEKLFSNIPKLKS